MQTLDDMLNHLLKINATKIAANIRMLSKKHYADFPDMEWLEMGEAVGLLIVIQEWKKKNEGPVPG